MGRPLTHDIIMKTFYGTIMSLVFILWTAEERKEITINAKYTGKRKYYDKPSNFIP
jgi:hypothetical protein